MANQLFKSRIMVVLYVNNAVSDFFLSFLSRVLDKSAQISENGPHSFNALALVHLYGVFKKSRILVIIIYKTICHLAQSMINRTANDCSKNAIKMLVHKRQRNIFTVAINAL